MLDPLGGRGYPRVLTFVAFSFVIVAGPTASSLRAQGEPILLADTNASPAIGGTASSNPRSQQTVRGPFQPKFVVLGGWTYFSATRSNTGEELWRSNGTRTELVKDIRAGTAGSGVHGLCVSGKRLFFRADDGVKGTELWVTDGTVSGTRRVADIRSGAASSMPASLARLGTGVVFVAQSGTGPGELWVSDGTAQGTRRILSSGAPATPTGLQSTWDGKRVFFQATTASRGRELWVTNGKASGTRLVKDIVTGSGSSIPRFIRPIGAAKVVFQATDASGAEPWVSDGTAVGTRRIKDISVGPSSSSPFGRSLTVGHRVYFEATSPGSGAEAWVTDGTARGTIQLRNHATTQSGFFANPCVDKGKVYFTAKATGGWRLFVSNGTKVGTKAIGPTTLVTGAIPPDLMATGDSVFFTRTTASLGMELYRVYSGQTELVQDIRTGTSGCHPLYLTRLSTGVIAFSADDGKHGQELWISAGRAGTTRIFDINQTGPIGDTADDQTNDYCAVFDKLFFAADDGKNGRELWVSDGTLPGTRLVKDIQPGSQGSNPRWMVALRDKLLFTASASGTNEELWISDGTAAGTKLVKDIRPGGLSSQPSYLTVVGKEVWFAANDSLQGVEVWATDGTTKGTQRIADVWPGSGGSGPKHFCTNGEKVIFSAAGKYKGNELWIMDSKTRVLSLLKDIQPGRGHSYPENMTLFQGKAYFSARTQTHGRELWVSDFTSTGTKLLANISPASSSSPRYFCPTLHRLYFQARTAATGTELWAVDAKGVKLVKQFAAGSGSGYPGLLTPVGGRRFYGARLMGAADYELSVHDAKTLVEKTYNLNPKKSAGLVMRFAKRQLEVLKNHVVFVADAGLNVTDRRVWTLDNGATSVAYGIQVGKTSLLSDDPVLGKTAAFHGVSRVPKTLNILVYGFPYAKGLPVGLGNESFIDLRGGAPIWLLPVPSGLTWTSAFPIPNHVSLMGVELAFQSWNFEVGNGGRYQLSNGLFWHVGR